MGSLSPVVPLAEGETLTSFVSRLAHVNLMTLAEFCRLTGLPVQDVIDGTENATFALSHMVDVPATQLLEHAIRRDDKGALFVRGAAMVKTDLRRDRLAFCPACLQEDVAAGGPVSAYGRLPWSLSAIRTCRKHSLGLCELSPPAGGAARHDWTERIRPVLPHLAGIRATAAFRPSSSFEDYLIRRIETGSGGQLWLDGLPWHVATKVCEVVGAVRSLGRTPNLKALTAQEWHQAAAAGFDAAKHGVVGLRRFMEELLDDFIPSGSCSDGPQAAFGRWWQLLAFATPDPSFDPVRDVVRDFVVERFAVGPGEMVLGREITERIVHSVRSASVETGSHPKRLRRLLTSSGSLSATVDVADAFAFFDAKGAEGLLAAVRDAVTATGAEECLGANRVQTSILIKHGFIEPFSRPDEGCRLKEILFSKSELDSFLAALMRDAVAVSMAPSSRHRSIRGVAKSLKCQTVEVVSLVIHRKLKWVGRIEGQYGFDAILVDIDEVWNAIGRIWPTAVKIAQVSEQFSLSSKKMVSVLISFGFPVYSREVDDSFGVEVLVPRSFANEISICYLKSNQLEDCFVRYRNKSAKSPIAKSKQPIGIRDKTFLEESHRLASTIRFRGNYFAIRH